MNTIVFGATGRIGSKLVDQLLEGGHSVTAFVRDPKKVVRESGHLDVVTGDVLNLEDVAAAIEDKDAVFITLGAGLKGSVRSDGTANIVSAMEGSDVKRLIVLSTLGAGESYGNLNFYWKYLMFGLLLRSAFADHQKQEKIVKESALDWTLVRPGAFTEGELTGELRHGFGPEEKGLKLKVSIADVSNFMAKQLSDDTYLGKAAALSY